MSTVLKNNIKMLLEVNGTRIRGWETAQKQRMFDKLADIKEEVTNFS
jgi:hypothetical protein